MFLFRSCNRIKRTSMPGWALNIAVDELLKKEFDLYQKRAKTSSYYDKT